MRSYVSTFLEIYTRKTSIVDTIARILKLKLNFLMCLQREIKTG